MIAAETYFAADDVQRAIEKMQSLRDGEAGVIDAVACGRRVVPALRALLFAREPSGIYQPRCWAVQALSILGAYDVLFEFLSRTSDARDAVERAGDDAVINAAAQYLSAIREERVFQLLLGLSARRYWPGVVAALASFRRKEAIPYLLGALGEDDCRLLAEPALAAFGPAVLPALLDAARDQAPSPGFESETSIRKRKSALTVLHDIGVPPKCWQRLRPLISDREPRIALLACELCFCAAKAPEWNRAVGRVMDLLESADWRLEAEIEECIFRHYGKISRIVAETFTSALTKGDRSARALKLFLRVSDRRVHLVRPSKKSKM